DRSLVEPREIAIAELALLTLCDITRHADRRLTDRLADVARAGMQNDPHVARLIEAQLDEVVAAAERTELLERLRRIVLTDHVEDAQLPEALMQLLARLRELQTTNTVAHRVDRLVVRREADRHTVFDLRTQTMQRIRQIARRQRRTRCRHTAADVHADGGRDDRGLGRNHRTHRCTLAE